MSRTFFAASAALAVMAAPALADEARTPPPGEPYYAPQQAGCDTIGLKVYFEPGKAELTPFARDAIRETRERISGCAVMKLDARATAADADTRGEKLSLAEARRAVVMEALQAHGIRSKETRLETEISAAASGVMARRVELTLRTEPARVG